jgi:hypothetical protein
MIQDSQPKIWGYTKELIGTPYYSRHKLEVVSGSYCSLHYHLYRANKFIVESGKIAVIEMYGPKINKTILGPDNSYIVPSLVVHMFAVIESGVVYEEYYGDRGGLVANEDIVRIIEGGTMPHDEINKLPSNIIKSYSSVLS